MLENCKYDFTSDNINIIVMIYDRSGSMYGYISAMKKANNAFKRDFLNFEDKGSIAISKAEFASRCYMSAFLGVESFDEDYSTGGGTALYDAVVYAANNTISYYNEIVKRLNVRPRITFLVFSDGLNNDSYHSREEAHAKIAELNSLDATTVFVAFGEAVGSGIGERLGFSCTKDITTVSELVLCMGKQLSKSCKEQSRSAVSLKSEFFSKAEENSEDDNVEENPISDDDFFDF